MNLVDMRTIVRRDLRDEDANNYRWTNDELDRHIGHAVKDYSGAVPYEQKAIKPTVSGSREIDISALSDRIMIEAVEYPIGNFPRRYQRFSLWGDIITLLGMRYRTVPMPAFITVSSTPLVSAAPQFLGGMKI